MLERAGRPIAVGTLLSGDGRILTALSPLTHGNQIVARYPEGQLVPVKLSHSDRAWDLALLTPEGDARRAGLKASHEPAPAQARSCTRSSYVRDKQLGTSDVTIKTKSTLRGGDSAELADALELAFAPQADGHRRAARQRQGRGRRDRRARLLGERQGRLHAGSVRGTGERGPRLLARRTAAPRPVARAGSGGIRRGRRARRARRRGRPGWPGGQLRPARRAARRGRRRAGGGRQARGHAGGFRGRRRQHASPALRLG